MIEFSVEWRGGDFYFFGYGIDCGNVEFCEGLCCFCLIRENRIFRIVERLQAAGLALSYADVMNEAAGAVPGKPHVARALVRRGFADSFEHAFDVWLSGGKPGDVSKEKISAEEAFRLIRISGGIAVVAHPISLGLDRARFEEFLRRYIGEGLSGVEAYAEMHSDSDILFYREAAANAGLFVTGGSDFHGDKDEKLGCCGHGRVIPDVCGENLLSALESPCRS